MHRLPVPLQFAGQLPQVGRVFWRVRQVQLSTARVVAVHVRDESLGVLERLGHLRVQPVCQFAVLLGELLRSRFQLRDHHPAVAARRAPSQWLLVEYQHIGASTGGGLRSPEPAVAGTHHDHIRALR